MGEWCEFSDLQNWSNCHICIFEIDTRRRVYKIICQKIAHANATDTIRKL